MPCVSLLLGREERTCHVNPAFDAAAYVTRVRRRADLSQRELAARVGVSQSVVNRWEGGAPVSANRLATILALAGLRLCVVDGVGQQVDPTPSDVVRDNAGRRFPSHLDVDPPEHVPPERVLMPRRDRPDPRGWYRLRDKRDARRAREGAPTDHPTLRGELQRRLDEVRRRRLQALARAQEAALPECECLDGCFELACLAGCSCQCEPDRSRGRVS